MNDIVKLIQSLISSGQIGILIISLILVIGGAVWIILLQRQTIKRFETLMKAVELNMSSSITVNELTQAAQKEIRETWKTQFDLVTSANEELRKEIGRLRTDQDKFKEDVRKAMSLGFEELKFSLSNVTVQKILDEIPESFKKDLENEISEASNKALSNISSRLKETTINTELREIITDPEFMRFFEHALRSAMESVFYHYRERDDYIWRRDRFPFPFPFQDNDAARIYAEYIADTVCRMLHSRDYLLRR